MKSCLSLHMFWLNAREMVINNWRINGCQKNGRYFLAEVFTFIGIYVQELPPITAENVTVGCFTITAPTLHELIPAFPKRHRYLWKSETPVVCERYLATRATVEGGYRDCSGASNGQIVEQKRFIFGWSSE